MVFKLISFVFSIIFSTLSVIFNIEFDGIPLWSITLFVLILVAVLKILLSPVLSGNTGLIYTREKARGYKVPIRDNGKFVDSHFIQTKNPGRWRR